MHGKIKAIQEQKRGRFVRARRRLLQRLYHEAFHVYLSSLRLHSIRRRGAALANEGLAQIFETAVFEVGELHVRPRRPGPPRRRSRRAHQGTLLPTADSARADSKQFAGGSLQRTGVFRPLLSRLLARAFDLAFNRELLGTKTFYDYITR